MASHRVLVVDPDERSRRLLEVSLRKAGYAVEACGDAEEAFARFLATPPDLVITETRLEKGDGFELLRRLKERQEGNHVPVVLLSSDRSVESKVRGLQWGAADYLTKPIYVRELLTRVQVELQRRLGRGGEAGGAFFRGSLADMGLVDLLQTIEFSGKSGRLELRKGDRRATLWFESGRIVHAEAGAIRGQEAVHHLLRWHEGYFDLRFEAATSPVRSIEQDVQGLLLEGLRRFDEWERLVQRLPSLDAVLTVDEARLLERLAEVPDRANALLRGFDGTRDVETVLRHAGSDELSVLDAVVRLYEEGILVDTGRRSTVPPPPSAERLGEGLAGALVPASEPPPRANRNAEGVREAPEKEATCATAGAHVAPDHMDSLKDSTENEEGSKFGTLDATLSARDAVPLESAARVGESSMPKRKGKKKRRRKSTAGAVPKPAQQEAAVIQFPNMAAGAEGEVVTGSQVEAQPRESAPSSEASTSTQRRDEEATGAHPTDSAPSEARRSMKKRRRKGRSGQGKARERDEASTGAAPGPLEEGAASGSESAEPVESESPRTTSSQMIQALTATGEHAAVTEEFFQSPSDVPETETWDDLESAPAPTPPHERKARRLTLAIVSVGVAVIGGYLLVQKVFLPQPAEVGGLSPASGALPSLPEDALRSPDEEEARAMEPSAVPTPPSGDIDPSTAKPPEAPAAAAAAEPTEGEAPAAAAAAEPTEGEASGDYETLLATARGTRGTRKRIAAFEQALAANPEGVEALEELGFLYLNRGKMDDAIRYAERAVRLDPTRSKAWITLGAARQSRGDRAGAQEAYRNCVEHGQGKFVAECKRMLR